MDEMNDVLTEWRAWTESRGFVGASSRLESLGMPHKPVALPPRWQGIYSFRWQAKWLKIGKAGPNSQARWVSHHYGAERALSTLAFSLVKYGIAPQEDPELPGLRALVRRVDPYEIGDWIKKNTYRVDVLIGAETGSAGLSRLESIAHRRLSPVFEGPWKFGEPPV
jgi:hypothetical protein